MGDTSHLAIKRCSGYLWLFFFGIGTWRCHLTMSQTTNKMVFFLDVTWSAVQMMLMIFVLEHVANGLCVYTRKKRELSKLVGKHMYSEDISQFQVDQGVTVRTKWCGPFWSLKGSQTSNKSISDYLKTCHGSILTAVKLQDTPNWNISNYYMYWIASKKLVYFSLCYILCTNNHRIGWIWDLLMFFHH